MGSCRQLTTGMRIMHIDTRGTEHMTDALGMIFQLRRFIFD